MLKSSKLRKFGSGPGCCRGIRHKSKHDTALGCKSLMKRGLQPKLFLGGKHVLHDNNAGFAGSAYKMLNKKGGWTYKCLQTIFETK